MDFNEVYILHDQESKGALHVAPTNQLGSLRFSLVNGTYLPNSPVVFTHASGQLPMDLISTSYAGVYLISDRLVMLLESKRFEGWSTFPATVRNKNGTQISTYHGLVVTGRCGPIDDSLSKKVQRKPDKAEGKPYDVWLGLFFDPDSWDGSDIFMPQGTLFKFVTKPVKDVLEEAGLSNIDFTRIGEVERLML